MIYKGNNLKRNYWSIIRLQKIIISCRSIKSPYLKTNLYLVIESGFAVHVFCRCVKINKIANYKIPKHVIDQNSLEILIENMKKMATEQQQTEPQDMIFILKLVMSSLLLVQEKSNKHLNHIYQPLHSGRIWHKVNF